ncbi:hypothetical protein PDN53_24105 [Bacillus cereus]|nr:hypothetical protein [Bacillus cereus]
MRMKVVINNIGFETIDVHTNDSTKVFSQIGTVFVKYTVVKGKHELSGVTSLEFSEYKHFHYNNLIDHIINGLIVDSNHVTEDM